MSHVVLCNASVTRPRHATSFTGFKRGLAFCVRLSNQLCTLYLTQQSTTSNRQVKMNTGGLAHDGAAITTN